LDNPEDLTRFDAFLREIGDRAATQGEPGKDSWTDLKSRLSKPGYINGYRPLASAVLEAIALGVLLAEWNDAVELWPPVPRRTGHSDALVLAEPPLNCEVTCRWSDQDLARRDFSPRRMTGAQTGADAYWDKLTRAAAEKSEQMRSDMLNVLFMAALFEYDPRLLEEDGAETAESILARSSQKLGRSGKRVVVFDFDGTLKLARTYAPPDLQPDEAVVIDKLRAAFTSHWPSPRAVECEVLPTGLWDALSLPQDIRRRKTY
jgi:hypothetical protein